MSNAPLPPKGEVAKEIGAVATTLSNEMQAAALKKALELGLDLNKGRLSLEETLINLSQSRDILADAAQKGKLTQLPLKLQYALYAQTQKISEILTALVNGTDAIQPLEEAVDDLTASIWSYNLHNLSEQVLGFHEKMNQLKAQETQIRKATRAAEEFETSEAQATHLLAQIESALNGANLSTKTIAAATEQISTPLAKATEQEQAMAGLAVRIQQTDVAATQHEANAKTANAEIQAIAARLPVLQSEIDELKGAASKLNTEGTDVVAAVKTASDTTIDDLRTSRG
jgi:chromosome segregation ATPase